MSNAGSAPNRPIVARDVVAGAGVFEYCDGAPSLGNHLSPPIDVDTAGGIHVYCLDAVSRQNIWYSMGNPWCTWSPAVQSASVAPTFPTHPSNSLDFRYAGGNISLVTAPARQSP